MNAIQEKEEIEMSDEREAHISAKSQLLSGNGVAKTPPAVMRVSQTMLLLAAVVALSCWNTTAPTADVSAICLGLAVLALIALGPARKLMRQWAEAIARQDGELKAALEESESRGRHKDAFVAWASRELRAPLTAILGSCDRKWEGDEGATIEEHRVMIQRSAARILAVAETMVEHAGKSAPMPVVTPEARVDVHRGEVGQYSGRVLLAEDGEDNRKVIEFYLQKAGVQFVTVADGKSAHDEAMAAAKRFQPYDLILMDVQMPVSDGCEATILLRDHKYRAPIVALTANATEKDRQRCLAAGYNGFLTKPIDVKKFAEVLARYLRAGGQGQAAPAAAVKMAQAMEAPDPRFAALKESFLNDMTTRVSAIEKAISSDDTAAAAEMAHQLKGTAGCYGLPEVSAAAGTLQMAAEKSKEGGELKEPFGALRDVCRMAVSARAA